MAAMGLNGPITGLKKILKKNIMGICITFELKKYAPRYNSKPAVSYISIMPACLNYSIQKYTYYI